MTTNDDHKPGAEDQLLDLAGRLFIVGVPISIERAVNLLNISFRIPADKPYELKGREWTMDAEVVEDASPYTAEKPVQFHWPEGLVGYTWFKHNVFWVLWPDDGPEVGPTPVIGRDGGGYLVAFYPGKAGPFDTLEQAMEEAERLLDRRHRGID